MENFEDERNGTHGDDVEHLRHAIVYRHESPGMILSIFHK